MHDCTEEEGGREREIGDCDDDRRSASDFLRAAGGGVAQIKRKKIEEHHEEHEGEGGGVEGGRRRVWIYKAYFKSGVRGTQRRESKSKVEEGGSMGERREEGEGGGLDF